MVKISKLIRDRKPSKYLILGGHHFGYEDFHKHGWSGVIVTPNQIAVLDYEVYIHAHIAQDPHILKTISGEYIKPVTVDDVFEQFPGPYDCIIIANTDMDRWLWAHQKIQDSLPHVYILPEDGHNKQIVETAATRGYEPHIEDGYLVLVHK